MTSSLKLLPSLFFKMAEDFENLDNILPDWAKKDLEKVLLSPWTVTSNRRKKEKQVSVFFLWVSGEIWNKKAFFLYILILYHIKQIDSMLLCLCSLIDHRGCHNVVRTSVTDLAAPCVPLFCSYHILTSSVIYYWTDAQQHGIYLLNIYMGSLCLDISLSLSLYIYIYVYVYVYVYIYIYIYSSLV